jgi:hypothetical protein
MTWSLLSLKEGVTTTTAINNPAMDTNSNNMVITNIADMEASKVTDMEV